MLYKKVRRWLHVFLVAPRLLGAGLDPYTIANDPW